MLPKILGICGMFVVGTSASEIVGCSSLGVTASCQPTLENPCDLAALIEECIEVQGQLASDDADMREKYK